MHKIIISNKGGNGEFDVEKPGEHQLIRVIKVHIPGNGTGRHQVPPGDTLRAQHIPDKNETTAVMKKQKDPDLGTSKSQGQERKAKTQNCSRLKESEERILDQNRKKTSHGQLAKCSRALWMDGDGAPILLSGSGAWVQAT